MAYYDPNAALNAGIDPNTGLPYAQGYPGGYGATDLGAVGGAYGTGVGYDQQGYTQTSVQQSGTGIDPLTGAPYVYNSSDTNEEYY